MATYNLKVFKYGSPILRKIMPVLEEKPEELDSLVAEMFDLMAEEEGIGLSANQVGKKLRFFTADFSLQDPSLKKRVFINPEIVEREGETQAEEGCLSLPGINVKVKRADRIKVNFRDKNFEKHTEEFQGMVSRIIQHETDHLNGKFMTDRISPLKRHLVDSKLKELARNTKEELKNR